MWRNHFEHLYNSAQNNGARNEFNEQLYVGSVAQHAVSFTTSDVIDVIRKQKLGKAIGLDGIATEAFVHGGHELAIHTCFLFNLFIKYGYLPDVFMNSVVVLLLNCKSGDLTDVNNYRAILSFQQPSRRFSNISFKHIYLY